MKIADVQSRCHGTRRAQSRPLPATAWPPSRQVPDVFDCESGYANWPESWSVSKKATGCHWGFPHRCGISMDRFQDGSIWIVSRVVVECVDPKKGQWYACWVSMHGCLRMCIVWDKIDIMIYNDILRYISCVQLSFSSSAFATWKQNFKHVFQGAWCINHLGEKLWVQAASFKGSPTSARNGVAITIIVAATGCWDSNSHWNCSGIRMLICVDPDHSFPEFHHVSCC